VVGSFVFGRFLWWLVVCLVGIGFALKFTVSLSRSLIFTRVLIGFI